jgi:hypothetical protein
MEATADSAVPQQAVAEDFFAALQRMAGGNVTVGPVEPPPEIESPVIAPETNETPPSSPDANAMMFFQALANMAGPNVAAPPTEPLERNEPPPPLIKMMPRQARPIPPTQSAADETLLSIANGHGRPAQYRPKTPPDALKRISANLGARPAPVRPIGPQSVSFKQPPDVGVINEAHEEFDFDGFVEPPLKKWRRSKLTRFFILEFFLISLLLPAAWLVLARHVINPTLVMLLNTITITAAVSAVALPIFFFAIAPEISRRGR